MSNLCFFHRRTSRYPAMESECGRTLPYDFFIICSQASVNGQ
jgi:hypothetical protein